MKWRRSKATRNATRRPLTFGDWLHITALVVLLMLIGGYFALDAWALYRVNAELAKIRDAGEPVILDDVNARDEMRGAGIEYAAAFRQIESISAVQWPKWEQRRQLEQDEQARLLGDFSRRYEPLDDVTSAMEEEIRMIMASTGGISNARMPDEHLIWEWGEHEHDIRDLSDRAVAQAQEMVDAYAEPLSRLRRAAAMDAIHCNHAISYRQQDHFIANADTAGRLLTASTLLHLNAKRFDTAAQEILTVLRLRRVTEQPRTRDAHRIDRSIISHAAALAALIQPHLSDDSPWLAILPAELDAAYQPEQFTQALIVQRAEVFQYVQIAYQHNRAAVAYWNMKPGAMIRLDMADFLLQSGRVIESSRGPLPSMFASFKHERNGILGEFGAFDSMIHNELRTVATLRAARTAMAVNRFRRDHGHLPQTLEELAPAYLPAPPIDPFTGTMMLFRADDDVYVIYGIGKDTRNDYGDVVEPGMMWSRDVGVRVYLK